jgi:hypothetical protein
MIHPFDSAKTNCTLKFEMPTGPSHLKTNNLAKLSSEQKPKCVLLVPWLKPGLSRP